MTLVMLMYYLIAGTIGRCLQFARVHMHRFFSVGMSFHRPCEKESDWLSMSSVIFQFFKISSVTVKLTKCVGTMRWPDRNSRCQVSNFFLTLLFLPILILFFCYLTSQSINSSHLSACCTMRTTFWPANNLKRLRMS